MSRNAVHLISLGALVAVSTLRMPLRARFQLRRSVQPVAARGTLCPSSNLRQPAPNSLRVSSRPEGHAAAQQVQLQPGPAALPPPCQSYQGLQIMLYARDRACEGRSLLHLLGKRAWDPGCAHRRPGTCGRRRSRRPCPWRQSPDRRRRTAPPGSRPRAGTPPAASDSQRAPEARTSSQSQSRLRMHTTEEGFLSTCGIAVAPTMSPCGTVQCDHVARAQKTVRARGGCLWSIFIY